MKVKNYISLMILLSFFVNQNFAQTNKRVKISLKDDVKFNIKIDGADKNDTLVVWVYSYLLSENSLNNYKEFIGTMDENHNFVFDFSLNEPGQYFLLGIKKGNKPRGLSAIDEVLLPCYYAEKGDEVTLHITHSDLKTKLLQYHHTHINFAGTGAMKYESQFKTDSLIYHLYDGKTGLTQNGNYQASSIQQDIIAKGLKIIYDHRNLMSDKAFKMLKTDFVFHIKNLECESLSSILKKSDQVKKANFKASIESFKRLGIGEDFDEAIPASQEYTKYQLNAIKLEALLDNEQVNTDSVYFMIKDRYQGELLDRVICLYFNKIGYRIRNYDGIMKDALSTVKRPEYHNVLKIYANRVMGSFAYNFTLPDTAGKMVSLNQFKGKVIVMDFWFTGCAACIKFFKNKLSKVEEKYRNDSSVVFISVCIDSGKDHWLKSVRSGNYTSGFAENLYTAGLGATASVIQHYNILSYPQPIIIDKSQRVKTFGNAETLETAEMIKIIDKLRGL